MRPDSRGHILRDDLESFVHVLFHHVIQYRPTKVGMQGDFVKLFHSIYDDTRRGTRGESLGGEARSLVLLNVHFRSRELEESPELPFPLVQLMDGLRKLFAPLYEKLSDIDTVNVTVRETDRRARMRSLFQAKPSAAGDADKKDSGKSNGGSVAKPRTLKDIEEARLLAEKDLQSSESVMDLWTNWLDYEPIKSNDPPGWSSDDGAKDQLPRHLVTRDLGTKATPGLSGYEPSPSGHRKRTIAETDAEPSEESLSKKRKSENEASRGSRKGSASASTQKVLAM